MSAFVIPLLTQRDDAPMHAVPTDERLAPAAGVPAGEGVDRPVPDDLKRLEARFDSLLGMMSRMMQMFSDLLKRLRELKARAAADMKMFRWDQFVEQLKSGLRESDNRWSAAIKQASGQIAGGAVGMIGSGVGIVSSLRSGLDNVQSLVRLSGDTAHMVGESTKGGTAVAATYDERDGAKHGLHTQFRRDASDGLADDSRRIGEDANQTLVQSVDTIRQLAEFSKQFYVAIVPAR